FDTKTTTDTDYWLGVQEDASGDDNDVFQIGKGTTIGTTPYVTLDSTGNVGIGTTSFGTSAQGILALGTAAGAPSTAIDGVQLFAANVSGTIELRVMDGAGNITTQSPHNFSLISSGPSEDMAWSFYSERETEAGTLAINADITKALRFLEEI